ncbi:DUF5658 family protein [Anaeromicrobium sediminis]|uniref:DUF5658 domain-containing protein n=1 Tax=Anaeromicrobium sediminis TaxID=1478221 RepID=A0A267MJR0_9FIRM|nr:DUF5658 family protein [Anaeromicrobium sediminis]PAB59687.1 hypothetical protein CCE28_08970 [Anaeromicrobium sediminis]
MSINLILCLLSFLMVIDYIVTYIEIHILNIATEMNPFMNNFMDRPFLEGIFLRILLALFFVTLFKSIEKYRDKKYFKKILVIPLSIQIIPVVMHIKTLCLYGFSKL